MFDHEKLHVYQLQLEFLGWVTPVLAEAQQRDAGQSAEVRRQLDRASLSTLLNIAEGNGKRGQRTRAKSFDDARGSAAESAACLEALVAKSLCSAARLEAGDTNVRSDVFRVSLSTTTTDVSVVGGDLIITDSNGGTTDYTITLSTDGASLFVHGPNNILTTATRSRATARCWCSLSSRFRWVASSLSSATTWRS